MIVLLINASRQMHPEFGVVVLFGIISGFSGLGQKKGEE